MGAKFLLLLLLLPIAYAQTAQSDPYELRFATAPSPAQPNQPAEMRIALTRDGDILRDFAAKFEVFHSGQRIYVVEGSYPTTDLRIPYTFPYPGEYTLRATMPDRTAMEIPFTIGAAPEKPARAWNWAAAMLLLITFAILVAAFRRNRRH